MFRIEGKIYRREDKFVILILDSSSMEKVGAKSSFFKVDTTRCKTSDEILLKFGFIGDVSVLVEPRNFRFETKDGIVEGTRYIAKSMRRRSQY